MLFSVLALLVVVGVVMTLAGVQLQAVKPAGVPGEPAGTATTRAADLVNKAVEQGAASRAADAASQ